MSTELFAYTCPEEDEVFVTWKIEKFSEVHCGPDSVVDGPKFKLPSRPETWWQLFIDICKKNSSEAYLRAESKDILSSFRFRLNYKISILTNDQDKSKNKENSFKIVKSSKDGLDVYLGKICDLKENKQLYDDVLTLECRFGVVRCSTKEDLFPEELSGKHLTCLSENLKSLYSSKAFTDFTIVVGNERFAVHKCVLSSRSPIFAAMLASNTIETSINEVEIKDLDVKIVKTMILYLYTGQLDDLSPDTYLQLYAASDKYALESLRKICRYKTIRNLRLDNICDVYVIGFYYNDDVLKAGAKKFILKNISSVLISESWKKMVKENNQIATELLKEAGVL